MPDHPSCTAPPLKNWPFWTGETEKATAKSWQINFIDISIFTAMWYPPSHGRDDPHYLQTDRPLHYNHPAPRQCSSFPSAQTPEQDPEVAAVFLVLFFFLLLMIEKGESNHSNLVEEIMETLNTLTNCLLLQYMGYLESTPFCCFLPPHVFHLTPLSQTRVRAHTHTSTHTFHYAKELLQGKFSQTLMASDCSLATPAF